MDSKVLKRIHEDDVNKLNMMLHARSEYSWDDIWWQNHMTQCSKDLYEYAKREEARDKAEIEELNAHLALHDSTQEIVAAVTTDSDVDAETYEAFDFINLDNSDNEALPF